MKDLLIVKVGTSSIVDDHGKLEQTQFDAIARQARLVQRQIVIVSSGAISAGADELGVERMDYSSNLPALRSLAAVGQPLLMERWRKAFKQHDRKVAQLLVTPYELGIERESAHFLETLVTVVDQGLVAIVNENDAIADEEIKVGDNDRLAAKLAAALGKTQNWDRVDLVLLSDIDGLYMNYGQTTQRLIGKVTDATDVRSHITTPKGSKHGTGGMLTKVEAAEIANESGVDMYLGNARQPNILQDLLDGKDGTHFACNTVRYER